MLYKKFFTPLIVIALLAAIFLPSVLLGWFALKQAEAEFAVRHYSRAAQSFEQAARLLLWRSDLWQKAGIAAAVNADPLQAIDYFQRAPVLTEPGWMWFGSSYLSVGNSRAAIAALQQGLQVYDSPALYTLLALAYRNQNNFLAESAALENQLRLNAGDAYAHYRLGLLLIVLEPEQALTHLMFAASLDPQFDPAVQTLRAALNLSSTQPNASQQRVTLGRALGLVQEWDLSILTFEKAIDLDDKNAEAWAWLGEAKQQTGGKGRTDLERALVLDGTSVVVRALRALYWNRQQKYEQMLAEYLRAAELEPTNPAWQAGLGEAYAKRGDLILALAAYQHAVDLAPDESTYWRLLAAFCVENGVHLEDVGLPAAQRAVHLAPEDPSALDVLGWVYLSSGRYANAEKILLGVIERFPDHLPAHIHLAMTYLAQGNRAAAFEQLTYVRSADPDGANGVMAAQLLKQYFP